ncbi:MAG: hypothetical protein HYV39_04345 [Candidatus Levybacteria bacterium]|nr:hypothetical protein [Candidatus Levybacteria bacterium]
MIPLKTQAIQKAFEGNWNDAISINKKLLKENPNDIETLNRLALAFSVLDKIKEARHTYEKVLAIDGQNQIALKNIKRITGFKKTGSKKRAGNVTPLLTEDIYMMFLEENGKTKVIELVNVAEPKIISHLMAGELLSLHIKRLKIFVLDGKNQYIGVLPDDIGKRLIKFIRGGNIYKACVKSAAPNHVVIFIKEVKRVSRFKNQPSFLISAEKNKIVFNTKTSAKDQQEEDWETTNSEETVND